LKNQDFLSLIYALRNMKIIDFHVESLQASVNLVHTEKGIILE